MRIIVTGGAGYIGSHTVVELLLAGHEVQVIDNFDNSTPDVLDRVSQITNKQAGLAEVDILDEPVLTEAFRAFQPEAVIHFAGLKAVGESAEVPLKYYRTNVEGSLCVFRAMQAVGCKAVVFSSSATIYGLPDVLPVTEDQPGRPTNAYGRTKFMVEEMIRDWGAADASLAAVNLRYFNPVGAHASGLIGENPRGVPDNLMPYVAQVASGQRAELSVFGDDYDTPDGTGLRDYIHVNDLARAHLAAIDYVAANTGVATVNVGTGQGYTVLDMIRAFEAASGRKVPYKVVGRRPGDVAKSLADVTLSKSLLGWQARHTLEDMCNDTWKWQSGLSETL